MSDRIALQLAEELRHPFLIVSREDLMSLPNKVTEPPVSTYYAEMLAWLEERKDRSLPDCPPGGLGEGFRAQLYEMGRLTLSAAVAWWASRDGEWLELAKRALLKIASWEYWRSPVHLPLPCDLSSGFTALHVGLTYDLLFEELDEKERLAVQEAILKHGTAFIQPETIDRQWWSWAHDGNWSYHTMANIGTATLAIYPERPEVRPAIETAAGHIQRSLDHIHPLGGWREGVSYGMGTLQSARLFVDALAAAGDARLADHPGLQVLPDFFLFTMLAPGRQVYFGDCGVQAGPAPVLYREAALSGRGDLQYVADERRSGGALGILWRNNALRPQPPRFDPPSRYWPQIGWAVLRESWEDPYRLVLATKAGTVSGGHQHPDCGTFLLVAYGKELISEPGVGTYSRGYHRGRSPIKSSRTHNCPIFDGHEQVAREFFGGDIVQFLSQPGYDVVKMELTHAYDYEGLQRWQRYFFLLRPELVVQVDEVSGWTGHYAFRSMPMEFRLHTFGEITLRDFDAVFRREGAVLLVKTLLPPYTPGLGDHSSAYSIGVHEGLETKHPDQKGPVHYLSISTECEKSPTVVVNVFVPGKTLEEAEKKWAMVEVEDRRRRRLELYYEGQTLVLDWGNRRWQLYWNVLEGRIPRLLQATVSGPTT